MLVIQAKEGQSIYVGDFEKVQVKDINITAARVTVHLLSGLQYIMRPYARVELASDIFITLLKIPRRMGNKSTATFGFEAPRDIAIHGDWNYAGPAGLSSTTLRSLTDKEFATHCQDRVRSLLEKELFRRFDALLD